VGPSALHRWTSALQIAGDDPSVNQFYGSTGMLPVPLREYWGSGHRGWTRHVRELRRYARRTRAIHPDSSTVFKLATTGWTWDQKRPQLVLGSRRTRIGASSGERTAPTWRHGAFCRTLG